MHHHEKHSAHSHDSHHCCGGCGDCHCHDHHHGHGHSHGQELSEDEKGFLTYLAQYHYLPVTRFLLRSSKSSHLESVALAPVYLNYADDSLEQVKVMGKFLLGLEEKGLISLDYDEPLTGFDYKLYETSAIFASFQQTVLEAKENPEFLYDIGEIEYGSIALLSPDNEEAKA